jgi:hypothetical protein
MKAFIIVMAMFIVGCSTVDTKTIDYCEVHTDKFLFIPYNGTSQCVSASIEDGENPPPTIP